MIGECGLCSNEPSSIKIPAGRDSTAATLTFVIYFLSIYPEHLRLREEILEKVGSSRRPDYDDIKDIKYLRAVINGDIYDRFRVHSLTSMSRNSAVVHYCVRADRIALIFDS
jgi:hypothetical protein